MKPYIFLRIDGRGREERVSWLPRHHFGGEGNNYCFVKPRSLEDRRLNDSGERAHWHTCLVWHVRRCCCRPAGRRRGSSRNSSRRSRNSCSRNSSRRSRNSNSRVGSVGRSVSEATVQGGFDALDRVSLGVFQLRKKREGSRGRCRILRSLEAVPSFRIEVDVERHENGNALLSLVRSEGRVRDAPLGLSGPSRRVLSERGDGLFALEPRGLVPHAVDDRVRPVAEGLDSGRGLGPGWDDRGVFRPDRESRRRREARGDELLVERPLCRGGGVADGGGGVVDDVQRLRDDGRGDVGDDGLLGGVLGGGEEGRGGAVADRDRDERGGLFFFNAFVLF